MNQYELPAEIKFFLQRLADEFLSYNLKNSPNKVEKPVERKRRRQGEMAKLKIQKARAKVDKETVMAIRKEFVPNENTGELAEKYGLSTCVVSNIGLGHTYTY